MDWDGSKNSPSIKTPLSALIGWKEWLMEHPGKLKKILPEMESDLDRLS